MPKKPKPASQDSSWRKIKQSSAGRAVTSIAKKRRWKINLRYVGAVAGGLALIAAVIGGAWWWQTQAFKTFAVPAAHLRTVYFESDGVLDQHWLMEQIELPQRMALMDINIVEIRRLLMNHGQTRNVEVERIFPDALRITVAEREPIARIAILDAEGKRLLYLVSADGTVYAGQGYSPAVLRGLPFLDGVVLRRRGTGFEPVEQAPVLAELLREARTGWPSYYADWRIVSCRDFVGRPSDAGALIHVKCRTLGDLTFLPRDFPEQLSRLEQIINYARRERMPEVESVDLSLPDPVARFAAAQPRNTRTPTRR